MISGVSLVSGVNSRARIISGCVVCCVMRGNPRISAEQDWISIENSLGGSRVSGVDREFGVCAYLINVYEFIALGFYVGLEELA